jgi:hypothetical protein
METFEIGQKVWFRRYWKDETRYMEGTISQILTDRAENDALVGYVCLRMNPDTGVEIRTSLAIAANDPVNPIIISDEEMTAVLNSEANEAFNRYCISVGGKTYDGKIIPEWTALTDSVRQAWIDVIRPYVCMIY